MNKLIYILMSLIFIVSCSSTPCVEDSNGFTPRDNKIKIGTQESVDVVLELDKYWSSQDFESMRPLLADSVYVSFAEGEKYNTADAFIQGLSNQNENYDWKMTWAFAIKDDNPEITAEWVNAGFEVTKTDSTGLQQKSLINDWYLVDQGKVVRFFNVKTAWE